MKIWVHTLVKDEEAFLWFSIKSVIEYVDKVLIWDTGSSDNTVRIIQELVKKYPKKIISKNVGQVPVSELSNLRTQMIKESKGDWIFLVDGDEIWPEKELKEFLISVKQAKKDTIAFVNNTRNCVGDIFHYLPENLGQYRIGDRTGSFNIRLIRKTSDLAVSGLYPLECYTNKEGSINNQVNKLQFVNSWYLHTSFLNRSKVKGKNSGSLGRKKIWERGIFLKESELPEVFFQNYPKWIPSPFKNRGLPYETMAHLADMARYLKKSVRQK